jgi:L-talarate/galactarate dehydratase
VHTGDRIDRVRLSLVYLPLPATVSDAKVPPVTEVAFLFAELGTTDGHAGLGFSYAKRAGGPALYAHAKEIVPLLLGEDPNDIARVWEKLVGAGASVGSSGLAAQAIAAVDVGLWDLKAKRANLPLGKLLGTHREAVPCYHTFGGPPAEIVENAFQSLEQGVGGIKIELGPPEAAAHVRRRLGDDVPLMVGANQPWDRFTALRTGRALEFLGLTWLEDPLDGSDVEGLGALAAALDTPIATGDALTSVESHWRLMTAGGSDILQPDAPRLGGITPFLQVMALANHKGVALAPRFATELHVHLTAAYPGPAWVEHATWLEPLFNEKLEVEGGAVLVPERAGIGLSLSERSRVWTTDRIEFAESV